MGRKYKRVFTLEAMIVSFFCAFILAVGIGTVVFVATTSPYPALFVGFAVAYAVIDLLMRSPNE